MTLASLFDGSRAADVVIARRADGSVSLAQFRADVTGVAALLAARKCRRGLLVTDETYWCAVGLLALAAVGADAILPQNTTPGVIAALRGEWDLALCDRDDIAFPEVIPLRQHYAVGATLPQFDPANGRLVLFTSGSTGEPKRVEKRFAAMEREAAALDEVLSPTIPRDAVVQGTVTHQHLFGLTAKLFWPLLSHRTFDSRVHVHWESLLADLTPGAVIVSSPAHLTRLGGLHVPASGKEPICLMSAGAPLSDAAARAAQDSLRAPLCEIYGSTETGIIATRRRQEAGPLWHAVPDVALDLSPTGTLVVRSPFLPSAQSHDTSDFAAFEPDGGFRLLGRADRIAKIEGKRVSLAEVESGLQSLPQIAAAALVALPDDPIVLGAVIVPSELGRAELVRLGAFRFGRLLRQALAQSQEPAAMPRRWRFVDTLPVGAMGKVSDADLRALFAPASVREPETRAVRRLDDAVEIDLFNRPDMIQLGGHFPGMPVVPGVAQIDWAVKLAARHLGLPIAAASNYQVKFQRLTLPGTLVTLQLAHDAARRRLSFTYRFGDETLTSGIIRLGDT
ncbi:AMP-binding protein [Dongia sp.]|uniref:AMP-binding protein n=1 Tax=Dongia sp. TaxID=1977262 RepID=UPI0035B3CE3D